MATHSSTLAKKIRGAGYSIHGVAKSRTRLSNFTFSLLGYVYKQLGNLLFFT